MALPPVPGIERRTNLVPPVEPDKERLKSSEELDDELLPRIPNEITLTHILPKLPWNAFAVLSSVCRGWKRALRSGHQHDDRVRSNSTETLAVVDLTLSRDGIHAIALYSVRDERFNDVPPIPCFGGFPSSYECVAVDGKLYVLGGMKQCSRETISDEVYVLDFVAERQWRQCASMGAPRHNFCCTVMDGKIYVFGGYSRYQFLGAEVYDPKRNSWSPITYNGLRRFRHRVTVVGDELVLHGGMFSRNQSWTVWDDKEVIGDNGFIDSKYSVEGFFREVYNPVTKKCGRVIRADLQKKGHSFRYAR